MISGHLIMDTIQKIAKETGVQLKAYTPQDLEITSEGINHSEEYSEIVRHINESERPSFYKGQAYFYMRDMGRKGMILACPADDRSVLVGKMGVLQIESILETNEERFDMDNFFKNLLLDNLLIVDIYSRARALHIAPKTPRVCFLIEAERKADQGAVEVVRSILDDTENNFVTSIDENNLVLIKALSEEETLADMEVLAETLSDTLNSELMSRVLVSYGTIAHEVRAVPNSYKEARIALSVGKIFNPEKQVLSYSQLGIGRLIYQLPLPMCRMFIDEIFLGNGPQQFDDETLMTINEFFANNLNVSETARKLYIHRNTLVYRLDKIQKMTNLDLRIFDDAITFKIALMVTKYMTYMESNSDGKRN